MVCWWCQSGCLLGRTKKDSQRHCAAHGAGGTNAASRHSAALCAGVAWKSGKRERKFREAVIVGSLLWRQRAASGGAALQTFLAVSASTEATTRSVAAAAAR